MRSVSGRCVNGDRRTPVVADRINDERQKSDVVEMGVGQKDVIDLDQLFDRKRRDPGPAVDQNVIVDGERCRALIQTAYAAAAAKDANFHLSLSFLPALPQVNTPF